MQSVEALINYSNNDKCKVRVLPLEQFWKQVFQKAVVKQNRLTYTFKSPSAARVDLVLALVTLDDVSPAFSTRFRYK